MASVSAMIIVECLLMLTLTLHRMISAFMDDNAEMERIYYNEVIVYGSGYKNMFCNLTPSQQATICKYFFDNRLYKSAWHVHFNTRAFFHPLKSVCSSQKIIFDKINLASDWSPQLMPCYGQHRPIRTNWRTDDYFELFLLSTGKTSDIMYVFAILKTGSFEQVRVIDRLPQPFGLTSIPNLKITQTELARNDILNTVETKNYNQIQIERIYVREIIRNGDPLPNPFETLKPGELLTVCLSIFSGQDQEFIIDRDAMLNMKMEAQKKILIFRYESQYDQYQPFIYPCRGMHMSNLYKENLKYMEMYYISPGRRNNSIFIYEQIAFMTYVRLVMYIENFDFQRLRPSLPSEAEIYQVEDYEFDPLFYDLLLDPSIFED